jgi:PAS domain S-box-containing protein
MRLLNSAKSLYSAVGILCLTLILGVYLDYENEGSHRRHLDITKGLEKMVRLNQELTNMLLVAAIEENSLRIASYDTVNNDLEETIKTVANLTKSLNLLHEVSSLNETYSKLNDIEKNVISLMSADKWKEARDILFGDEYQLSKKTYEIDNESVSSAVMGQLEAADQNFDRIKNAALGMRIGALLLILFVGVMFSRRTRADMAMQAGLRSEIEAANTDLEKRIADRTEKLEGYLLQQEERANLEAVFSALNTRLQTVENLQEAAKYALDAMVNFFKASRGAIFTPGEAGRLHRQATYAFPADSTLPDSFGPGEGTIGKCALQGEQMLTTPTDQSFWLHFGIGTAPPFQVLTYPLKSSDILVGVIELCLVEPIAEKQQQWLEKAAASISTALRIALEREEKKIAEERINLILKSTDDGIFGMDNGGYTTFANPAACAMLGYDEEQIIGKSFHAMFHHYHADGSIYYEDECTMGKAFKGERVHGVDTEVFWRHDGTSMPVEYSATPILRDNEVIGSVVSFRDITERKRMEESIKESEKRVRTILNSVNTGIILIDAADRTIVDVNPIAARMIKLDQNEIVGKVCHKFICPREEHDCPIIDLKQTVDSSERILLTANGEEVSILKTAVFVSLGEKEYLLESFVDLTERKKAEEELQQRTAELEEFNKVMIGRESRVIELKEEINALCVKLGQLPAYPPVWDEPAQEPAGKEED